ncbi:MAG: S-methyl-5'-thioadenosine phosphorylase [Candidatus Methanomethylicota archaeon]|uniref:Probable S-methyl-5'-thioinosine phosphorylase n=1 Tax=Thermoproteota archaeon TaxID=2056631 RepID=A0A497EVH8_9CREN|nr:MAG: S-methyl-5'-thioadenosine phosphorylase [Candidatus Verstraetearchaeota archaeon]RLE55981.1 MAG: S-methyl-5'-thioadenosine phosphorylase [Candidatus Verstraetearchaeota archaeon]
MESKVRIAIIGGSGLERALESGEEKRIKTPYGEVSITIGTLGGEKVAFIPRHGRHHEKPPHKVNYRGNIWALSQLGVERILASNAVGGIRDGLKPGDFVIVHDFIDLTKSRPLTFYDGPKVVHVDMTEPYCPELRKVLVRVARRLPVRVWDSGVYACTEGPRFETPAEIRMLRLLGADVVGMTSVPEVVLARELGICYATVCVVTNYAAGMQERITASEVVEIMRKAVPLLIDLFEKSISEIPKERNCSCANVLLEAQH